MYTCTHAHTHVYTHTRTRTRCSGDYSAVPARTPPARWVRGDPAASRSLPATRPLPPAVKPLRSRLQPTKRGQDEHPPDTAPRPSPPAAPSVSSDSTGVWQSAGGARARHVCGGPTRACCVDAQSRGSRGGPSGGAATSGTRSSGCDEPLATVGVTGTSLHRACLPTLSPLPWPPQTELELGPGAPACIPRGRQAGRLWPPVASPCFS